MEELKTKVERVVLDKFADAEIELEFVPLAEKWSGHVVTDAFSGLSQRDRHKKLWKLFRDNLNPDQLQRLSIILTLSPAEHRAILKYG